MRILQVANGYPPAARGGVETYTQTLAGALAARGHEVEVFCRVSAPREPEYAVRHERVDGIVVRRVVNDLTGVVQFSDHFRNPQIDTLFREHLADFQPDLVHVQHCLGLSATLLPTVRARGLPLIVTLHDFWYVCPRANLFNADRALCAGPQETVDCVRCLGGLPLGPLTFLRRWPVYKMIVARLPAPLTHRAQRSLAPGTAQPPSAAQERAAHAAQMSHRTEMLLGWLRLADQCIAPSEFVKAVYVRYGLAAEAVSVLPLGVEQSMPAAPRSEKPPVLTVVYAGSLQYHKGPDVLIRAVRSLANLNWRLLLFGYGDPADPFLAEVHALAAGDPRIEFRSPFDRKVLPKILAEADIVVVPSRCHETFSLIAREALLHGVPVVASRLGALPEIVTDAVNGYLVPPGDVGKFAGAITRASEQLSSLRAGTQLRAAAPTLAEHVSALEFIYTRALERHAHPVRD
jgi:glycosyltransferase involved in cell wall biosynthesis